MPKTKEQKKEILAGLKDRFGRAKSVVFASFNALKVKDNDELRSKLLAENSEYYVAKKSLLDLALKDSKIENLDVKTMDGKVAAVFSYNDEVAPAKIVSEFKKTHVDNIDFLGGILENHYLSKAEVVNLSQLPSKQELYSKLVGSINAPVSGFVNVLAGNIRALLNVLKAVEAKK